MWKEKEVMKMSFALVSEVQESGYEMRHWILGERPRTVVGDLAKLCLKIISNRELDSSWADEVDTNDYKEILSNLEQQIPDNEEVKSIKELLEQLPEEVSFDDLRKFGEDLRLLVQKYEWPVEYTIYADAIELAKYLYPHREEIEPKKDRSLFCLVDFIARINDNSSVDEFLDELFSEVELRKRGLHSVQADEGLTIVVPIGEEPDEESEFTPHRV